MKWRRCGAAGALLALLRGVRADEEHVEATTNEFRTFDGTDNNPNQPLWGSVGQTQLRRFNAADYVDGVSTPPGFDRPSPREILSEVFLSVPPSSSSTSTLYVGWALLLGFDLVLNAENSSEPLPIECNTPAFEDVWCPFGSMSEDIAFDRSSATFNFDDGGVRSPINFATAYMDLDWLYGRSEKAVDKIRLRDGHGRLNLTDDDLPHKLEDGTWLVADQRPCRFPVTFALQTMMLREHNRCCDQNATAWGATTEEEYFQFCRQWNTAIFQHITENDFSIKMTGGSIKVLGLNVSESETATADSTAGRRQLRNETQQQQQQEDRSWEKNWRTTMARNAETGELKQSAAAAQDDDTNDGGDGVVEEVEPLKHVSRRLASGKTYDETVNAGIDVFFSTVVLPAFYSALPPTVSLLDEDFNPMAEDGIELAAASADLAGLVTRLGGIEPILRGAAYSRTRAVDASFASEVSVSSKLFNFPVEAVQRGRDHGILSYNAARQYYGLEAVTSFAEITSDAVTQEILSAAHDKDVELLDAYTGAVSEEDLNGSNIFVGPLLAAAYLDQLYRAILGDRHHHSHTVENEDAALTTLSAVILRNSVNSTTMPNDAFTAPQLEIRNMSDTKIAALADGYVMKWELNDEARSISIELSARGVGTRGMIGIGFGGETMTSATDFVICVVSPDTCATCHDRRRTETRAEPPDDNVQHDFGCVTHEVEGEWTTVNFTRDYDGDDEEDFALSDVLENDEETPIIFAWRSGQGIGQHRNSERGASKVNLRSGDYFDSCDNSNDFYALHGALLLVAWLMVAPYGLYQARYRKGKNSIFGNLWWEVHEECMIICAEAVIPLSITAIVTTGGPHNSQHARWGFYMIAAVVLQIVTGWLRARALEAKGSNFSLFHRVNKYIHIYLGWFAYGAGLIQCYRGVELVSGSDSLVFSAAEIDFTFANFGIVRKYLVPTWLSIIPPAFLILEIRKQYRRYFIKGSANVCGIVEVINEEFSDETIKRAIEDRLMPRTEDLPIYTAEEFNAKILNGRSWIVVDGAVLDVSSFAKRHPGGARLILNAMGTDTTSEIMGEGASLGNSNMTNTFSPHRHTETALEIARSLVVGYIEEDDDVDTQDETDRSGLGASSHSDSSSTRRRRSFSSASGGGGGGEISDDSGGFSYRNMLMQKPLARGQTGSSSFGGFGGRLASFSSDDDGSTDPNLSMSRSSRPRPAARKKKFAVRGRIISLRNESSLHASRGSGGGGNTSSDGEGSTSTGNKTKNRSKIGPSLKLSEAAAAVLDPKSPTSSTTTSELAGGGVVEDGAEGAKESEGTRVIERRNTAPAAPFGGKGVTDFNSAIDSGVESSSRKAPPRRSGSAMASIMGMSMRPKALDVPVVTRHAQAPTDSSASSSKKRRSLKAVATAMRMLSMDGGATSGNDTDAEKEGDPSQFRATKRVWQKKNALSYFHVCPLLLHDKISKDNGRPVYKFVFSCPGGAAALVKAVTGVCHFNMRVAQDDGKVVQRAYSAFAVRVQKGSEDEPIKVVPIAGSSEGEACIEMWIRIYPDGAMSKLLLQLIKNADNPAVQLQGPFLQDRLIPPPAHRNVMMIAAGTGVNPMVHLIRDYLRLGHRQNNGTFGGHTRLVLLWQNTKEEDLYSIDELTLLQTKSRGLLEVVALLSGDLSRRNKPGAAFRRAKAKLESMGMIGRRGLEAEGSDDDDDDDIEGGVVLETGKKKSSSTRKRSKQARNDRGKSGVTAADGSSMTRQESRLRKILNKKGYETGEAKHERKDPEEKKETAEEDEEAQGRGSLSGLPSGFPPLLSRPLSRVLEEVSQSSRVTSNPGSREGSRYGSSLFDDGYADILARIPPDPTLQTAEISSSSAVVTSTASPEGGGGDVQLSNNAINFSSLMTTADGQSSTTQTTLSPPPPPTGSGHSLAGPAAAAFPTGGRVSTGKASGGRSLLVSQGSFKGIKQMTHRRTSSFKKKAGSSEGAVSGGGGGGGNDEVGHAGGHSSTADDASSAAAQGSKKSRTTRVGTRATMMENMGVVLPQSREGRGRGGAAQERSRSKGKTKKPRNEAVKDSDTPAPLVKSRSGLMSGKVSKELLKGLLGEEILKAIAATRVSAVGAANLETAYAAAEGARDALRDLCGSPASRGKLQIVVSGPAGFVFHIESLLAELRIPPEAVVLLD